jgi:hypothetical protein
VRATKAVALRGLRENALRARAEGRGGSEPEPRGAVSSVLSPSAPPHDDLSGTFDFLDANSLLARTDFLSPPEGGGSANTPPDAPKPVRIEPPATLRTGGDGCDETPSRRRDSNGMLLFNESVIARHEATLRRARVLLKT